MKQAAFVLAAGILAAAGLSAAQSESMQSRTLFTPQEIKWGPGPASLPAGAEIAVLYGDPGKEGLFAMRAKLPKDYRVPPHSHGKPEVVTVLSGMARLGMGQTLDASQAQALPPGSFFVTPPGMAHYFMTDEETVIQINSEGPWSITYVNPADDPRKAAVGQR